MTDDELTRLFEDPYWAVLAYGLRRVDPACARDVAGETFLVAWRQLRAAPKILRPWLLAVSRRVLANELRRQGRRDRHIDRIGETAKVDDRGRVHPDHAEAVVHTSPVTAAMASLPSRDRQLLQLIGWESAFAVPAKFERDLGRDRTSAGLQAARDRGRVGGRPTTMTPAMLKAARRMQQGGTPVTEIAKALSIGRATVCRHLEPVSQ